MTQPEASAPLLTTSGNPNAPSPNSTEEIFYSAFRQKTIDMKHWVPLPDSMPSVRQLRCLTGDGCGKSVFFVDSLEKATGTNDSEMQYLT